MTQLVGLLECWTCIAGKCKTLIWSDRVVFKNNAKSMFEEGFSFKKFAYRSVRQFKRGRLFSCKKNCPGRWMGRLCPMLWPPRSPDINPLDYFYWSDLKQKVYETPSENRKKLRRKLFPAAAGINNQQHLYRLQRNFI